MNGSSCSSGPRKGTAGPCHGTASSMIYHGPSVSGMGGSNAGTLGRVGEPKTRPTREGASTEVRGVPVPSWSPSAGAAPSAPGSRRAGFLRPSAIFAFLYRPKVYVAFLRCFGIGEAATGRPAGFGGLAGGEDGGGLAGLADAGSRAIPDARAGAAAGESPILVPGALARAIDSRRFQRDHARETQQAFGTVPAREFDTAPRVRAGRSRAVPPTGRAGLRTTPETCALALTARSHRPAGRHVRARSTFAEAPVPAVASSENEVAFRASGSFIPFPESQTVETSSPGGAVWHLFVFHPDVPGVIFCPSPIET